MQYLRSEILSLPLKLERSHYELVELFSEKQGSAKGGKTFYNNWHFYVWATILAFKNGLEPKELEGNKDFKFRFDQIFSGSEEIGWALVAMAIAKMKEGEEIIDKKNIQKTIEEYANAGFYHVKILLDQDKNWGSSEDLFSMSLNY